MNKMNLDVVVTRCDDNCASSKIHNILKTRNNNVNEHMVKIMEESAIPKNIITNICNVLLIFQDEQSKILHEHK